MRFQSKYPNICFTIKSQVNVGDIKGRPPDPGLRVEFRGNEFDSEVAQQQNGWTDDQRLTVETALTQKDEYGVGKTFWLKGAEVTIDPATILASVRTDYCSRTKITDAGPKVCGNATAEGAIFCLECLIELNAAKGEVEAAEVARTARERTPEQVGAPLVTRGPAKDPATGKFLPKDREVEPAGV